MGLYDTLWSMAIVGRGSSAAYYISTVDRVRYPSIVVIGKDDPWAAKRGHSGTAGDPTLAINHPAHLIEHLGKSVPAFSDRMYDRLEWAKANAQVLDDYTSNSNAYSGIVADKKVISIAKSPLPDKFRFSGSSSKQAFCLMVDDLPPQAIWAKKVVVASGAGAHAVPPEVKAIRETHARMILDIDDFSQLSNPPLNNSKTVFVMGPNAAIDAVQKALHYGCRIVWLIRGETKPAVLASQDSVKAAVAADAVDRLIYRYGDGDLKVSVEGSKVKVVVKTMDRVKNAKTDQTLWGDYFVYGVGQDRTAAVGIVSKFLDNMEPIYDRNQHFGGRGDSVIGFEAEGDGWETGFEVVGSLCAQVAASLMGGARDAKELGEKIDKIRGTVMEVLQRPVLWSGRKPYLARDLKDIQMAPRKTLCSELDFEINTVLSSADKTWVRQLQALADLLKNYHVAANHTGLADKLRKPGSTLTVTVADSGQLGAISAQVAAMNTFIPAYIGSQSIPDTTKNFAAMEENRKAGKKLPTQALPVKTTLGEANFNRDDRTTLAVYVALNYPYISEGEANGFVERVVRERRNESKPLGYTLAQHQDLVAELSNLNREGAAALMRAKTTGTGQTQEHR